MEKQRETVLQLQNISKLVTPEILKEAAQQAYHKKHPKRNAEMVNYQVNSASEKGDGYMGVIYRIQATLENGDVVQIIGKGMPASERRRKMFRVESFFKTEVKFYSEIFPALHAFEKVQRGKEMVEKNSFFAIPDCYHATSDGLNDFLLLEDLTASGYQMAERVIGINATQIVNIIETLARFHAMSVAFKHSQPQVFDRLTADLIEPIFSVDRRDWIEQYLLNLSQSYIEVLRDDKYRCTKYLQKFQDFVDPKTFYDRLVLNLVERGGSDYDVLNHGDVWSTNFLFSETLGVKAIDFQLLRRGSLMLDVSTVILACTTLDERTKLGGVRGILKTYLTALCEAVRALKCPVDDTTVPSEDHLYDMWKTIGIHGLGCAIELVPLSLLEGAQDLDVTANESTDLVTISKYITITSEAGKKRMADIVRLAVEEGLI